MNWDWKDHVKKNIYKIIAHIGFEYTSLAAWYMVLEGDPIFWPIGILSAFCIHLIIFTKIDFLHELHHHHSKKKGHANHIGKHEKSCTCKCKNFN
jgi:hypothetical protein